MSYEIDQLLLNRPLGALFSEFSCLRDLFYGLRMENIDLSLPFSQALEGIAEAYFEDFETTRLAFAQQFSDLLECLITLRASDHHPVSSLRILGGHAKDGSPETLDLTLSRGDVVGIVGPTGSGKSRLLGDIECLAQGDTPTGRHIMLNGSIPGEELRFSMENRLVAQLSQNMNFVMDLTVEAFLYEHAQSRLVPDPESVVAAVFSCANDLAGESFSRGTTVTQLSGGQSRALMIADAALLSDSPIVLIDEIENAGIDRRKAISLLAQKEKIVLISTHDPLLALSVDRRLVIQNGAVVRVVENNAKEKANLPILAALDQKMLELREKLRQGQIIEFDLERFLITERMI